MIPAATATEMAIQTSSDRTARRRHVHIVGIGGAGMSPLARILAERGDTVTGSDAEANSVAASLTAMGVHVFHGHHARNIAGADLVAYTAAARPDNPELLAAASQGIRTIRGADLLAELMEGKKAICVAGTHGKTTTTAMIASILTDAGSDPSYVVGGEPRDLPASGHHGSGPCFVAEADEFDRRFLSLRPWIAVITSMDLDHPDCYPTRGDLRAAFAAFVARIQPNGWLVACADDPEVRSLAAAHRGGVVTYGLEPDRPWHAETVRLSAAGGSTFSLVRAGAQSVAVRLSVPGRHNVSNAVAALAASNLEGVDVRSAASSLAKFHGVKRRFEAVGEAMGATLIDDYAHHPAEIRATLAAARARYPERRIVAVHQPHTYSRLKALLTDFAVAFGDADIVLVTDIYASRESDTLGIHARDLVGAMRHPAVTYAGDLPESAAMLSQIVKSGDVVITLGAGNINSVLQALMAREH